MEVDNIMGMSVREALEVFDKESLIDLVIEHGDNGYYPLEIFLLKSNYSYSPDELVTIWNRIYSEAVKMDERNDDRSTDLLRDGAEMYFEHIKQIVDTELRHEMCQALIEDLNRAAKEDGIGMKNDSEWVYAEVAELIEKYDGGL